MMDFLLIVSLWICLLGVSNGFKPFETIPSGGAKLWTKIGRAHPDSMINLTIVLSNPNDAAFEEHAMRIATPFSGVYRKHLTASELAEWVKPPQDSIYRVQNWLLANDIKSIQNHELLQATIPIHKAEALLKTVYNTYSDKTGHVLSRTEEYFIPEHLSSLIEFVHPTVNFPHSTRKAKTEQVSEEDLAQEDLPRRDLSISGNSTDPCANKLRTITPECVYSFYNVTYRPPVSMGISVENFLTFGEQLHTKDLQMFLQRFNKPAARAHPTVKNQFVTGGKTYPPSPGFLSEQDLDLQMIVGYGWPLQSIYTTDNQEAGYFIYGPLKQLKTPPPKKLHHDIEEFVDYLHSLAHQEFVPGGWTTSEYYNEADRTERYLRYICKIYGQLGARGVSMFTGSGDEGSTGERKKGGKVIFQPSFPNSCPFITNVGGTVYDNGTERPCTVANRRVQSKKLVWISSGGGFSKYFDIPKYQQEDVLAYAKKYDLQKKYHNAINWKLGRAWPDISSFGIRIPAVVHGRTVQSGGTSASSPMSAALFGFLNAYEKSKGRPPLGFLNPWIYKHPELFHDFTHGAANEAFVGSRYKGLGFPQAPGWDAVTGLGSPRYDLLLKSLDDMADAGALG